MNRIQLAAILLRIGVAAALAPVAFAQIATLRTSGGITYIEYVGPICPTPEVVRDGNDICIRQNEPGVICIDRRLARHVVVLGELAPGSYNLRAWDDLEGTCANLLILTISEDSGKTIAFKSVSQDHQVHLQISGIPGARYEIERSSDLEEWTPCGTLEGGGEFIDTTSPEGAQLYYRAKVEPLAPVLVDDGAEF